MQSNKNAEEFADERVKTRLEILTREAATNPNLETPTLMVINVAEQGTMKLVLSAIRYTFILNNAVNILLPKMARLMVPIDVL